MKTFLAIVALSLFAAHADASHRGGGRRGGCAGNSGGCQGGQGGMQIQWQYNQPKGEPIPPPKMADCPTQVQVIRVYAVQGCDSGSCGNGGGRRLFGRRGGCH